MLARIDHVRINQHILRTAGRLHPAQRRSLDAIHLATALQFESELRGLITYDERMAQAAEELGIRISAPE